MLRQFNGWRRDFDNKFEQPSPAQKEKKMSDAFELEICQGKYRYRYEAGKQEVWRNGEPWAVMNGRRIGDKFVFSLAVELDEALKERDALRADKATLQQMTYSLKDRLEVAEKERDSAMMLADRLALALNTSNHERDALRAEVIHIKEVEFPRKAQAVADGWRGKCERLEAKIAEMERQEPVAWAATDETRTVVESLGMNQSRRFDTPLFLAAGAQPAPSVLEWWIQRGMAELEAIRSRQDDDTLLDDRTLIERIGKAMIAAAPEAKP